ncbi:MAG: hypothetical protein FIB01_01815 [Gemmatimonadetes bacterium]|nr:hypothetical protein [Gemmatimonadota bacterium]
MSPSAAPTPSDPAEPGSPSASLVTWEAWREPGIGGSARTDLSTLEALRLLNEVRCFGRIPLLLIGHPLRRGDLGVLVEHGARIGLAMRLAPGGDALTAFHTESLRDAGLQRVAFDADARPWPALLQEVAGARAQGLGVHVTMRVDPASQARLPELGQELERAGVHVWTLAFPTESGVPMLRGAGLDAALLQVARLAAELSMQVEVAGAPQVHRVLQEAGLPADLLAVAPADGVGLLHVRADGVLQPSAALALGVGDARQDDLVDAFRESPALGALRDPERLGGKCRFCEYAGTCGGSRARAWAFTGDALRAPDPAGGYLPADTAATYTAEPPAAAPPARPAAAGSG